MNENFFHPQALVESEFIGPGTRVWAFAHVMPGARIGANCNLGDSTFVEGGAVIGNNVTVKNNVCIWEGVTLADGTFVGPNVAFTNDLYPRSPRVAENAERYSNKANWLVATVVEEGCSIGANATIIAGARLGQYSLIAAGSVVTRDVEPFALVAGNPARRVGTVCHCGRPREKADACSACDEQLEIRIDDSPRKTHHANPLR